jgi:predicted Rossmann-fold nucleotide-binding protein
MRLAIFCSSKESLVPLFDDAVRQLIHHLEASGRITSFVYGGGDVGLMGLIRKYATLPVRGHNLPRWNPLPDEAVYDTLRERQCALVDDADAYLILAGGVGTMYELFQVLCENDVEKRDKPVFIYDPDQVYAPLQDLLDRMHTARYVTSRPKVDFFRDTEGLLRYVCQRFQGRDSEYLL